MKRAKNVGICPTSDMLHPGIWYLRNRQKLAAKSGFVSPLMEARTWKMTIEKHTREKEDRQIGKCKKE